MSFVSGNRTTFSIMLICLGLYLVLTTFVQLPGDEKKKKDVNPPVKENVDTLKQKERD